MSRRQIERTHFIEKKNTHTQDAFVMKGSTISLCTCKVQVDPVILSLKSHLFIYIYWSGGIGKSKKTTTKELFVTE